MLEKEEEFFRQCLNSNFMTVEDAKKIHEEIAEMKQSRDKMDEEIAKMNLTMQTKEEAEIREEKILDKILFLQNESKFCYNPIMFALISVQSCTDIDAMI